MFLCFLFYVSFLFFILYLNFVFNSWNIFYFKCLCMLGWSMFLTSTIFVYCFPPFLLCQRGRSIISGKVEYSLYIFQGEFNHSNLSPLLSCSINLHERCVIIIKKGEECEFMHLQVWCLQQSIWFSWWQNSKGKSSLEVLMKSIWFW